MSIGQDYLAVSGTFQYLLRKKKAWIGLPAVANVNAIGSKSLFLQIKKVDNTMNGTTFKMSIAKTMQIILTALSFCWFPSVFRGSALTPGPDFLRMLMMDRLQKSSMDRAGSIRQNERK